MTRLTRRGRVAATLGILLLILIVLTVPALLWLRSVGLLKASDPSGKVTVVIPEGSSTSEIGDILEDKGVVASATGFRIGVSLEGGSEDIQAGKYTLSKGLSAKDALSELLKGPEGPEIVRVTFPEGSWLVEFADTLEANTGLPAGEFEDLATSGSIRSRWQPKSVETLEGLLFPATYDISEKQDVEDVIELLVDEFDQRFDAADASRAKKLGVTPYEAAIVASMIEAEALVDEERPKIASVIYNRLEAGTPLGIDATIIYGLGERGRDLTTEDLQQDTPYNTREILGLPPTPIGSSGETSLEAALHPANTDLFYYVLSDCKGHHAFSETYDEFLQNKAVYEGLTC
ncbi:MAG TPA: endolytic transglycosylase MltG [Actinomycetota bacterium]|nr:endolytic transglycosylase MltG [Actinomycetota bacterium]